MWMLPFRRTLEWQIKESEKIENAQTFQLNKLWNMGMKVITLIVGVLGKVPNGLERELVEMENSFRIEIILIWRHCLEYSEEFWRKPAISQLSWTTPPTALKNSQGENNNNNNSIKQRHKD